MTTVTNIPRQAGPAGEQLLQLTIQQDPEGHVTATVPVRWCVSARLIRQIREHDMKKPYVLLVVRSITTPNTLGYDVEEHQDTLIRAVPLTSEMSFISFSRPGRNEIRALVVDLADKKSATIVSRLRAAAGRYYNSDYRVHTPSGVDVGYSMLHHDGTPKGDAFNDEVSWIDVKAKLEVDVPAAMFAPPPPAWLKSLVKAYFRTNEFDQCHFRKRAGFSLAASVILMPIIFCVKVVATLVALFLGLRKIPYRTVLRPLDLNPVAPVTEAGESMWFFKRPDEYGRSEERSLLIQVFSLPVLVVLPLIVYGIAKLLYQINAVEENFSWLNLSLREAYLYTIGGLIALVIIVALVVGLVTGVSALIDRSGFSKSWKRSSMNVAQRKREKDAREAEARRKAEEERRKMLLRDLMAMTCNRVINPGDVSLTALPKEKQTVTLRFYDLKTKVCRPFAR